MALSADPGVSTSSLPPSPQAEKLSPALGSLPDLPAGWLGCRPGTREDRDLQGSRGFASNLPRGSGLDWRAELPHGLGAMRERGRRWRRGGSRDVRQQSSQLAGKVLGARWRSAVWGGGTGAGSEAEQVRRDVRRVMGVTQPGRLSSERRKLLVSAGCLRFQDGEEPWVAGAPFPRKLSSPAQRWVADCSWSQPSARLSSQLSLLDRGVVSSLSACLRQACFRHSKGTGGPPLPRGAQGGFNGAAGQAWGHAQQCSTLLHSTVVGRPG